MSMGELFGSDVLGWAAPLQLLQLGCGAPFMCRRLLQMQPGAAAVHVAHALAEMPAAPQCSFAVLLRHGIPSNGMTCE